MACRDSVGLSFESLCADAFDQLALEEEENDQNRHKRKSGHGEDCAIVGAGTVGKELEDAQKLIQTRFPMTTAQEENNQN